MDWKEEGEDGGYSLELEFSGRWSRSNFDERDHCWEYRSGRSHGALSAGSEMLTTIRQSREVQNSKHHGSLEVNSRTSFALELRARQVFLSQSRISIGLQLRVFISRIFVSISLGPALFERLRPLRQECARDREWHIINNKESVCPPLPPRDYSLCNNTMSQALNELMFGSRHSR